MRRGREQAGIAVFRLQRFCGRTEPLLREERRAQARVCCMSEDQRRGHRAMRRSEARRLQRRNADRPCDALRIEVQ